MKMFAAAVLSGVLLFAQGQIAPAPKNAEAAWAEVLKASKPPALPADWTKEPTAEQKAERSRMLATKAEEVAELAKKFYTDFPEHANAADAKKREASFRNQAATFRKLAEPQTAVAASETGNAPKPADKPKLDPAFEARLNEALDQVRDRQRKEGPEGALAEYSKWGRILAKEFPDMPDGWRMLYTVTRNMPGSASLDTFRFLAANGPAELKEYAKAEVKRADMVGKPLKLSFTATDGTNVDIAKLKGKVVLIDFWATWCGPCIASLPEVTQLYQKYHDQGLEIIGLSFDEDCDEMKRFVRRNKMPWPQFCDGQKWDNAMNKQFEVRGIPTMFLVGKDGLLRDVYARENLPEKIADLIKE